MTKAMLLCSMGAIFTLGACASAIPTERLQTSSAAIRAAEEVGADRVPQAALHLQLAKEQSDRAKKLIDAGDRDEAALLLTRAEADANLAVALARNAQEQREAQLQRDRLEGLKSETTK